MFTYLSDHKKKKIYDKCQSISKKQDLKIRDVASFIGTLTSTFPANEYGPLYYRAILKNKDEFLKVSKGNFNARIDLTKNALQEIKCWENNIFYAFKLIRKVKISKVIILMLHLRVGEPLMAILPQVEHGSPIKKDYI